MYFHRSPDGSLELFFQRLSSLLSKLDQEGNRVFLTGDFNANILESSVECCQLLDIVQSFHLSMV